MAKIKLLFICLGNTCRSPMAAAIAQKQLGDGFDCMSAGVKPGEQVSDKAKSAVEKNDRGTMRTMQTRKLDEELLKWADKVYFLSDSAKKHVEGKFSAYRDKCTWYTESGKVPDPLDLEGFPGSLIKDGEIQAGSAEAYEHTAKIMAESFTPALIDDLEYFLSKEGVPSQPSNLSQTSFSKIGPFNPGASSPAV